MKPVKVRIVSRNKGDESQIIEQHYRGQLAEKQGKNYLIYDENEQSGLEGTKTTIKWDQERVLILRNGSVQHRQEFAKGLVDHSLYLTPYLKIPLKTETRYVYTYFRKGAWHLEIEYALYHDADLYGEMQILIEIEGI